MPFLMSSSARSEYFASFRAAASCSRSCAVPNGCWAGRIAVDRTAMQISDTRALRAICEPRFRRRPGPSRASPSFLPLLFRSEHLRVPVVDLEAEGHEGRRIHPAAFVAPRIFGVPASFGAALFDLIVDDHVLQVLVPALPVLAAHLEHR